MSERKPKNGELLTLWRKIRPNKGYTPEEIRDLAKKLTLSEYTANNMLSHGKKQQYIIYEPNSQLYYRSDSNLLDVSSSDLHIKQVAEPDEIATTDIVLTISRDIEELKQARQEQKKLIAEKERLERNINELNQKIENLSYLDRFIGHQTI
jgi:hypothetical protein